MALVNNKSFKKTIIDTLMITPSGALTPGPLSASAVAAGASLGIIGGFMVAIGHLIVEFPYFVAMGKFMTKIEERLNRLHKVLDLLAAVFMGFFAYLLVDTGFAFLNGESSLTGSQGIDSLFIALVSGALLTGLNVYFLTWWLTVGKPIIDGAFSLGSHGIVTVYGLHFSYDLVWLVFLSWVGAIGRGMGSKSMGVLMFALAVLLVYYMVRTILQIPRAR